MKTPEAIKNFKVIDSCVETQRFSLEETNNLAEGAIYEIDFLQDFSSMHIDGQPITSMPVASIIELINRIESASKTAKVGIKVSAAEEYQNSQRFWEQFTENEKEERKQEKKWKEDRPNRKKRSKHLFDDIDNGLYFVDWEKVNWKRAKKLRKKANGRGK